MAPVEAAVGKTATFGPCCIEIEIQSSQEFFSRRADSVVSALPAEATGFLQTITNRHAKFSGEVVVARACENEFGRAVLRNASPSRFSMRSGRERFQGDSHQRPIQTIKLVTSERIDTQKVCLHEQTQVIAGSLGRDIREHREFARGTGFATEETPQHGGT